MPDSEAGSDKIFATRRIPSVKRQSEGVRRILLAFKAHRISAVIKRLLQALLILGVGYAAVLVFVVWWAFEVKYQRWPTFLFSSPFVVRVGDDIEGMHLPVRLERLGYQESKDAVPEPGQWNSSGSELSIFFNDFPVTGRGIVSGPASIPLDLNRIRSIRLLRSHESVNSFSLEPELIHVIPAAGSGPELCRPVPLEKIPSLLIDAIVLTEDSRFFLHQGIDLASIVRALQTNIRAGKYVQGASTITQQLMKMTLLSPKKTLARKINEVMLSVAADAFYSKKTILQAYLNRVYFGHWGMYPIKGVAEASRNLFGKDLTELSPAECALLAATIRAPNVINPHRHPDRARSRRNMILGLLFKAGKISRDAYDEAIVYPVKMRRPGAPPVKAPAFVEMVKESLQTDFPGAGNGRTAVLTSLDPILQSEADSHVKQLGEPGLQGCLIIADPQTGLIKALTGPSPRKWSGGVVVTAESLLPFMVIPSLVPEKQEHPKFTLTAQVFGPRLVGGSVTFREAFNKERPLLIEKLMGLIGPERIVSQLKEFGINAKRRGEYEIEVKPITPLRMARSYCILANLGHDVPLNPGVGVVEEFSRAEKPKMEHIPTKPAFLYMVNHLLKRLDASSSREGMPDRIRLEPSVFVSQSAEGLWGVCYRQDALVLLSLPGTHLNEERVRKLMIELLPPPGPGTAGSSEVPDGVVMRRICVMSGLRATSMCPHVIMEPFLKGTQPTEWCPIRHESSPVISGGKK